MAKSRTQKFYDENPEARKKKQKYDAAFNKRKDQTKKRVALNKYNRDHKTAGNGDRLDASHKGNKIVGFVKQSSNRGDKNNAPGDRRARGRGR